MPEVCGDHGENEPTCDICDVGQCFSNLEWNGETGNHVQCEIDNPLCMHGMSDWLCMGPNHYPTTEQEMRGELWP
jgi:hypothetical protein